MPDKWKEKQQKTCVGKYLIPSFSLYLSLSLTHTLTHKQTEKEESASLGRISFAHITA